jgi:hypothetical protein
MKRVIAKLLTQVTALCLLVACASPRQTADTSIPKTDQELAAEQLCLIQRGKQAALPPKRFTTDGCSMWPDSDWGHCCVAHDMEYWCGGTAAQRSAADKRLQQCLSDNGNPAMGTAMRIGTRLGGWWLLPLPWRWGYGWPWLDTGD